jgi:hypothetical protein
MGDHHSEEGAEGEPQGEIADALASVEARGLHGWCGGVVVWWCGGVVVGSGL